MNYFYNRQFTKPCVRPCVRLCVRHIYNLAIEWSNYFYIRLAIDLWKPCENLVKEW